MRVAVAHEWLVGYAGSERVVEAILEVFPDADLLTTVMEPQAVPPILRRARPSFLQRVPLARRHHRWFLPAMPAAWRLRAAPRGVDVVVSSSHACAKAVPVEPGTPHLCYCHTPMRYAWDFGAERDRVPVPLRPPVRAAMAWFRRWDRQTARRVDRFVANSRAVAGRIRRFYGRDADVIHPPVSTEFFTPDGVRGDDFLYVGRLVAYKRPDLVVDAFADLPYRLLVVGEGSLERRLRARAGSNVVFLGSVGEERLRDLYRSARALVFPGEEDFGIVMAEAHACGTPVVAFASGGAADIVAPGETGWLLERQTVDEVQRAVRVAATTELDAKAIRRRGERFSRQHFHEAFRAVLEELVETRGDRRQSPRSR